MAVDRNRRMSLRLWGPRRRRRVSAGHRRRWQHSGISTVLLAHTVRAATGPAHGLSSRVATLVALEG